MDRADIALHLDAELPGYLAEFRLANWDGAINAALRMYGIAEADLADPDLAGADSASVYGLALYAGLSLIERVAARRVNISVGNPSSSKSAGDAFERIRKLRADQGRVIAALGYSPNRGMLVQTVTVPYLTTEPTGGLA